jgi:photosystem II stability/assembly factor-like uncharacterized protein
MKKKTIILLLFILLLNLNPSFRGRAEDGPSDIWQPINNPTVPGGEVQLLAQAPSNPDILYAGLATLDPFANSAAQILERSLDGGETWQNIPQDGWSVGSMAVDAENPSILYATRQEISISAQEQLIRSLDGGATWQPFYDFGFQVAAPSPGRIYLLGWTAGDSCPGGTSRDFARSLDSGQTWQRITVTCDVHNPERMFVNPSNPDQIFLTNTYGPLTYASSDGGLTWQVLELNGNPFAIKDIAFDPAHPGRLFVATSDSALWTSPNDGADWSACATISATPVYPYLLQFSQGNLYLLTQGHDPYDQGWHIYRSQDACASWWKALDGLPSFALVFLADPRNPENLVAATRGYGIFRSSNGGTTWKESNTGLSSPAKATTLALSASDPDVILAAGAWPRPAVYRSTDGGSSWSAQVRDAGAISLLIDPNDPKKAWMATYDAIFYSADGEIWSQTLKGPQVILDLALSAADPDHPYAAGADDLASPDQGYVLHWGAFEPDYSYSRWIPYPVSGLTLVRVIAVNPRDGQDILAGGYSAGPAGTYSAVYRSRDGGRSWHEVLRKEYINQVRALAMDPSNPSIRYVMIDQVGILRSQDSGETWQNWSSMPPASGQGSKLGIDDLGGVYLFKGYGYYRGVNDVDWTTLGANYGILEGALWRGNTPFILAAREDGLWRLDLLHIQQVWMPLVVKSRVSP